MCGAGARGFARRTFDVLPDFKRFFTYVQNDRGNTNRFFASLRMTGGENNVRMMRKTIVE